MFTHERGEHTATLATAMVRLGLVVIFLVFVGRLYFLQIMQGATYQTQADNNRFRFIEVPPPRGVIYDRNGEILARNRPSFMISIVPAELPDDQIDTDVDEERLAIERLLQVLRADTNTEIALSGRVMFRLGRADFCPRW